MSYSIEVKWSDEFKFNQSAVMHPAKLIAAFVWFLPFLILTQNGCVLPGGLQAVGGQSLDGRLVDPQGRGIPNAEIVLLQGHFDKLDAKTVKYLNGTEGDYQVERAAVLTDFHGYFSHKFRGFSHCHPTWIFPPLLTLPSKLSGATRHGTFFIIKTPEPDTHIYEITVGKPEPSVLMFDPQRGRRFKPNMSEHSEGLIVRTEVIPWTYATGYTARVEQVHLKIMRD